MGEYGNEQRQHTIIRRSNKGGRIWELTETAYQHEGEVRVRWENMGMNRDSIPTQGEVREMGEYGNEQRQHTITRRGKGEMGKYGNELRQHTITKER